MQPSIMEALFLAERPRLLRLCGRLSGQPAAAEDLVQETFFQAWKHADRLPDGTQAAPWLSGIARNVCLHWSRRHYRERAHLYPPVQGETPLENDTLELLDPDFDLEVALERTELIILLDRALGLLPPETRAALVQKYVDELPTAEIAAHLGVNENAVAARIHRGKLAFRRILATELQDAAVEYGLLRSQQEGWEPTRLWCLACGTQRLEGCFQKDAPAPLFALRCPSCDSNDVSAQADLAIPFYANLLGKFKTYKPAYKQLLVVMGDYCRQAIQTQQAACLVCGAETVTALGPRPRDKANNPYDYEVLIWCPSCQWGTNSSLGSLALSLPEVQALWLTAPHTHILPTQEITFDNSAALLVPIRSGADTPGKDVIFVRDTFALLGIYPAPTGQSNRSPTT